jgi:hypothetical protein
MDLRDVLNYNEQYESARAEVKSILLSILEAGEITQSDNDALDSLVDKYNENYNTIKALGAEFHEQLYRDKLDALERDKLSADPNAILNVLTQGGRDCSVGIDSEGRLIIDDKAVPKLKLVELEVEKIVADLIEVGEIVATKATIEDLKATNAVIENLKADIGDFQDLTALKADIQLLKTNVADINTAVIGKANITDLDVTNANVTALQSNVANITTLIGGNLTMDNIQSLILTTDKVTVADAFIKDAMIDSLSANKIKTGSIDTNLVSIQSTDGSMTLNGSLQQFKDKDGNVRIQIGKDASGNFTFALYDKTGNGQLINENGITASAISDGLIVNDMVADNANISGSKLDINSVITQINGSTTTINSSKIYFDDKGQSLDVAFSSLSTKVDNLSLSGGSVPAELIEQITTNTTQLNVQQGQINTLISNTTITKEDGQVVQLKDEFSTIEQDVDSITAKISSLETNDNTVNSKISTIEQTLEGVSTKVSNTETKMNNLKIGGENLLDGTTDVDIIEEEWSSTRLQLGSVIDVADSSLKPGDTLILRAYVESCANDITPIIVFTDSSGNENVISGGKISSNDMPGYVTVPAILPENATSVTCYLSRSENNATSITYSKAKLEDGTVPTDWSPSINDVNNSIDTATQMTIDGQVIYIKDKVAEHNVKLDGITQSVSSLETHFDENGTVTNLTQQVSTLEQFAAQFTMEFFEKVENADQSVTELLSYIHFDADGITIGQETYPIRLQLTKDRIKFLDLNDQQVAYFSEGKLYVNNAEILDTFKIGNYGFMSTANGGLTIGALS